MLGKSTCIPCPILPVIEKKMHHVLSKAQCFHAMLLTKVCSFVFAAFQNVFQGSMLVSSLHASFNELRSMPDSAAGLCSLWLSLCLSPFEFLTQIFSRPTDVHIVDLQRREDCAYVLAA